jgi:hypothetical protein
MFVRRDRCLLWILWGSWTLTAFPEEPVNLARMEFNGRSVVLKQIVAFAGKEGEDSRIVVVATSQPLSASTLQAIQEKAPSENYDLEITQAYLKGIFRDTGEIVALAGRASNGSFYQTRDVQGEARLGTGNIVQGSVQHQQDGVFAKKVEMTFRVPFNVGPVPAPTPVQEPPVQPTVTGTFTGNGQKADLRFISVKPHEPFNGQRAITLLFTEKDHSKDPKATIKAVFGEYGSCLILSVKEDGSIFGCEVAHRAHAKSPFTALGEIHMAEFDASTGNARGHVQTPGELDTFDQKWSVDLTFAAPIPKEALAPIKEDPKPKKGSTKDSLPKPTTQGPQPRVDALPLPSKAQKIEYKQLVKQIKFTSPDKFQSVAQEVSRNFTGKGWKQTSPALIGPKSAIIKLSQDQASITAIIKPAGPGSEGTLFTENLDWSSAKNDKPAAGSDADEEEDQDDEDFEKEALDTINNALKGVLDED